MSTHDATRARFAATADRIAALQERRAGELAVQVRDFLPLGGDERASRLLRLDLDWRSPTRRSADLTFRIVLILKLQWERQIRMLDRGEEAYPF